MNIPERNEATDLLVRAVDGSLWSEACYFCISREEGDKVGEIIREYNKDGHLDLFCNYDNDPKDM